MAKVTRKENEPVEAMLKRFNKLIQQSGILSTYRKKLFFEKPPTRLQRRREAIRKKIRRELKRKKLLGLE